MKTIAEVASTLDGIESVLQMVLDTYDQENPDQDASLFNTVWLCRDLVGQSSEALQEIGHQEEERRKAR